jgi:hypothetical protein
VNDINDIPAASFSPREAAELLDQTTRQARREFTHRRPLLNILQALTVIVGFGAVWLSVRDQHPYHGPSWAAIVTVYVLVGVVIGVASRLLRQASDGVSGPTEQRSKVMLSIQASSWLIPYVVLAVLAHSSGVSHAFVFGQYLAAVPFLFVGVVTAITSAMQGDTRMLRSAIVIVVVAGVAVFTGPVVVWLVMGLGLGLAFIGSAILTTRQLHA